MISSIIFLYFIYSEKEKQKKKEREQISMIKDPATRAAIMSAATKAAREAINANMSSEEVVQAAQNAIQSMLAQYKPTVSTVEKGLEQAIKFRDEILAREGENGDRVAIELEINDYPVAARGKVIQKDFLATIHELTNCNVVLRGTYFEPHKKVPLGQKKLYLYIEGENKFDVEFAHREIQLVLEETAKHTLMISHGHHTGKYAI